MIITLELSTEEESALRRTAEAAGVDIDAVLHRLIMLLAVPQAEKAASRGEPGAASGSSAASGVEEEAERRREQEEMQANIRRWHAERGLSEGPR